MLKRWLDRLFRLEEINGGERCPTYLYRRTLLRTRWFQVYLHHFVGDDWSRDMHDHPKRFVSVGLWGRYVEETPAGERLYRAPWVRTFPAEHVHRLRLVNGRPCWTLVIVLAASRPWGFWHAGRWIHWREYVGGEVADRMKNCPDDGRLFRKHSLTADVVINALLLTDFNEVDEPAVQAWRPQQLADAYDWAMREHFHANDNPHVERRPEPAHVTALRATSKCGFQG